MRREKESKNQNITVEDMNMKPYTDNRFNDDEPFAPDDKQKHGHKNKASGRMFAVFLTLGIVSLLGGIGCLVAGLLLKPKSGATPNYPDMQASKQSSATYSSLTGEQLADAGLKTAPVYCIQTPNGTDGARPQSGLKEAGVIFEAIAEAGITRFAAIYQNPGSAVIGPIRSLRLYYLEWDTPFDCTIVHAGGADDALEAVRSGGYKDLSENYAYMYRGTYGSRLWNNLFTTSAYLKQFSEDYGYTTSNIKGFTRMTPEESQKSRVDKLAVEKLDIVKPTSANTSEMTAGVSNIALNYDSTASFNVRYSYDESTNTYLRSYESGAPHEVYECEATDLGERNPEDVCTLSQMNPSVVVAMLVQESRASDGYHEDIAAIGSGEAYVFQNGTATKGSWSKSSAAEQIRFYDEAGNEVALAPGQTFVSAIPGYGSVEY